MKVEVIIRPDNPPPSQDDVLLAAEIADEIEKRYPNASVGVKVIWS